LNQVKEIWQSLLKFFNSVYKKSPNSQFLEKGKNTFAKMKKIGYKKSDYMKKSSYIIFLLPT
jgi:hypothetical protein